MGEDSRGMARAVGRAAAVAKATGMDLPLRANDPRFGRTVQVAHSDGSFFSIASAFAERWTDEDGVRWLAVFPEHHPVMVFCLEDVLLWRELTGA